MRPGRGLLVGGVLAATFTAAPQAFAAELPPHAPLDVLVISDAVNPHQLSPAELTEPGDISFALNQPGSGLSLTAPGAAEVSSQCIDDALAALAAGTPNVVVYFAHQAATSCGGADRQRELTAAFTSLLEAGGGVVVFHHGAYEAAGKDAMLTLLGVRSAGAVPWDTTSGQRVFAVAPAHFVAATAVSYAGNESLAGSGPIPSGVFPYFDNIPDERYPDTQLLTTPDESRTILFATSSGGTRALGYALERPAWAGRVVFYQPAEYQPQALDDLTGPNFQILANSILYAARAETGEPPGAGGGPAMGGATGSGGSGSVVGGSNSPGGAGQGGQRADDAALDEGGCSYALARPARAPTPAKLLALLMALTLGARAIRREAR